MDIQGYFEDRPVVAVAFSGGVDSAYLLYAARQYGKTVKAYYVKTAFQPQFELEDAQDMARSLDVPLRVLTVDILSCEGVPDNPPDRCYHCKRAIFQTILEAAGEDGIPCVMDGTNASDDIADRPGWRALQELGVLSPLRDCGLTKEEIRRLSREAGLFTWRKPAYACLATRVPTGTPITEEMLEKTERAESFLFSLGLTDLRVRWWHGAARIQVPAAQWGIVTERREEIYTELKEHYTAVLLDLEVR